MDYFLNNQNLIYNKFQSVRLKLAEYFAKEHIQEFYLRAEVFLENGKSAYEMLLGKEAGKMAGATERLLQNNDAFAPVGLGLFVKKATFASSKEYPGNDHILSFVDDDVFDGAAVGGFTEAQCVEGVYNADLSINADGKEILYKLDTAMLKRVPDYRFQANSARYHYSQEALADYANFQPLFKDFVLMGGNENKVTLDIRGADTGTIEAGSTANDSGKVEQNKAVIIFPGLIIRGGADKVTNLDMGQFMRDGALYLP